MAGSRTRACAPGRCVTPVSATTRNCTSSCLIQTVARQVRVVGATGLPVAIALAGAHFVAGLRAPNRLRISPRHGSRERGAIDNRMSVDWDEDSQKGLDAAVRILEMLNVLQEHARVVIRTPDFTKVPSEEFDTWRIAAAMLHGEELSGTWEEGHALIVDLYSEVEPGDTFGVTLPHVVQVDDQNVDLGHDDVLLENPTLLDRVAVDGGFRHVFTTLDRSSNSERAAEPPASKRSPGSTTRLSCL